MHQPSLNNNCQSGNNNCQSGSILLVVDALSWTPDWAWGLPIIVLSVVIHVWGLAVFSRAAAQLGGRANNSHQPRIAFMFVIAGEALFATCLHGLEVCIWAVTYFLLGALPDVQSSMLYSLNAMTSYGHTNLSLEYRWQLIGALEAVDGWLLFGLTTAFLFAFVQKLLLLAEEHQR